MYQSWNRSGSPAPVRPDRTRPDEKFIRLDETGFLPDFFRFFAGFLLDFCRIDVKNEPDGFYQIFFDFFLGFFAELTSKTIRPDFCRIFTGFTSKMIRPDFDRTGPERMQKSVRFQLRCVLIAYSFLEYE